MRMSAMSLRWSAASGIRSTAVARSFVRRDARRWDGAVAGVAHDAAARFDADSQFGGEP